MNAGVRQDRDAEIKDFRSAADLGVTHATSNTIATRGERLALIRCRYSHIVEDPGAFSADLLGIVEIDADERIEAWVTFDPDDFDAAIAELDARYLAGEAAAHAHTWSAIAGAYAAFNRREPPATTPDWVNIDHRRGAAFAPGDMIAYLQAHGTTRPTPSIHIEAVHRLSDIGAVVTHRGAWNLARGLRRRVAGCQPSCGRRRNDHPLRAIRRGRPRRRAREVRSAHPAGAATGKRGKPGERALPRALRGRRLGCAWPQLLADDYYSDDRRRVVERRFRHGRDAEIENMRALADVGLTSLRSTAIAARGERLILTRIAFLGDEQPEAFRIELLSIIEINADEPDRGGRHVRPRRLRCRHRRARRPIPRRRSGRLRAHMVGDRRRYAALNRHEIPSTTTDLVNIDHRRVAAFGPGDLIAYLRAGWERHQDIRIYVEAVHRLNDLGAVVTHAADGTSREGFDAEWRAIDLFTVEGDLINRCEIFDEADLDAAHREVRPAQPAGTAAGKRGKPSRRTLAARFAARDWDAMAEILADNFSSDDRRRVVGAGIRARSRCRDRGHARARRDRDHKRIASTRHRDPRANALSSCVSHFSGRDQAARAFRTEVLNIIEIDADERIVALVAFDPDDFDAAIAELDARYLAGEAAAHAHTWSAIAGRLRRDQPARIALQRQRTGRTSTTDGRQLSGPAT